MDLSKIEGRGGKRYLQNTFTNYFCLFCVFCPKLFCSPFTFKTKKRMLSLSRYKILSKLFLWRINKRPRTHIQKWFKIKRRLGTLNPPHTHTWRRLNYYLSKELIEFKSNPNKGKQAAAELCQSRVILEVIFKVVVKVKSWSCNQRWDSTTFAVWWRIGE